MLRFENVAAFKCTYLPALTAEMIEGYGKLVDLGTSEWLAEVGRRRPAAVGLRHLLICFDDGPCYEFLCEAVAIIEQLGVGSTQSPMIYFARGLR